MGEEENTACCEGEFWINIVVSLGLVLFAGVTSGLSLGLLTYSKVDLEVLIKAGLPKDAKNAAKVLPIVKNECFVLCTLLIAKSLATEALPIFLDSIIPFWCAILISVIFVVAFVEVIPQAVCSRHGLSLGAKFTFLVRFLFVVLYPVSFPVSKLLDWLLGENRSSILRRAELKTLVDLHGLKAGKGGELTDDETTIISGALGMTERVARDAMTPLSKTFSLDINSKLDIQTMKMIGSKGHSRVPIHSNSPSNIIGLILVKNLIFYHPEDETPIKNLTIRRILRVCDNWPLYDVLKLFQEGHGHMAVVVKSERDAKETSQEANNNNNNNNSINLQSITIHSDIQPDQETNTEGNDCGETPSKQGRISQHWHRWEEGDRNISNEELESLRSKFIDEEIVGIITMEDVLEELLQGEILDETDHHVEMHDKIRVRFVPSRRSSSTSPGSASGNRQNWTTPASSFSSYYHPSVVPSPLPSYFPSPLMSPGKLMPSSSRSVDAIKTSLSFRQLSSVSRQVSRMSNEAF